MCSGFHSVAKLSSWIELFQLSKLFLSEPGEKTLVGSARERVRDVTFPLSRKS